jgi:hypothetical protein
MERVPLTHGRTKSTRVAVNSIREHHAHYISESLAVLATIFGVCGNRCAFDHGSSCRGTEYIKKRGHSRNSYVYLSTTMILQIQDILL